MVDTLKELLSKFIRNVLRTRMFILCIVMAVLMILVAHRLYNLQILNGEDYLNNYTMSIEKEISVDGTRGNIYDRNGVLLAYNELSYTITLEDNGSYDDTNQKNEELNSEISTVIDMIESNGDSIVNSLSLYMDENGELSFLVDGTSLQGFRRDVYGRSSVSDLKFNTSLGYDEASATTEQMYEYLINEFGISTDTYGRYRAYQIMVIRYALSLNSYQKYISTDIARDVSDETVAMIEEHLYELQGVGVSEDTKRVYNYPEYFSHIIGYTGTISQDEYETLSEEDDSYTLNDTVGKSGIEQYMELELQGKKGYQTVYVNNVGKVLEVKESVDSEAGNDVWLSIDANLQMAVYDMLEQELAGIVYSEIIDAKENYNDELYIPVYDVYTALIDNRVIDITQFSDAASNSYQRTAYQVYIDQRDDIYQSVSSALKSDTPFEELDDDTQEYITYIITWMQDTGLFDTTDVNSSNDMYNEWKTGTIPVKEYLKYAIESSWIKVSDLELDEKYADTDETYSALVSYCMEKMRDNTSFDRIIYKYLIMNDYISGNTLCLILFEQGVLDENEAQISALKNGTIDSCSFLKEKIKNLEITPAQLALDPCTGSCVIMDPNTGELLACVSYPGYDTNRLANNMDSSYYNSLLQDASLPLYNNATQQATAPGSTFKMVTATAGLSEGVIDVDSEIKDEGIFEELGYNLKCWIYPGNHGYENVVDAIKDSCNYFFCTVGYRLSMTGNSYSGVKGINVLTKYAEAFGLGDDTGLEIAEGSTQIATEYPVSAAIGQSNNKFTTVQLARYVSAIANEGTVYNLTLISKVTDSDGKIISSYEPDILNEITDVSSVTWQTVKEGMREVVVTHSQFNDLTVELAGKTGTAQENENRPNHSLFVGYAPVDDPQMAVAVRIAYGYGSGNACDFADDVVKYYFEESTAEELLSGQAADVEASSNSFTD